MISCIANTVVDPRKKLQALSLVNEVFKAKMELTTNGVIVRGALDYVNGKDEKLKLESESESESKESKEPDYGEEELEEGQEKDTRELEEEKTADEDIDTEKTHNDLF